MFERLRAICIAETENLAELAYIASPDDPDFFDGADFSGADLRNTDLHQYRLRGVSLDGAEIDKTSIFPDIFPIDENQSLGEISDKITEIMNTVYLMINTEIEDFLNYLDKPGSIILAVRVKSKKTLLEKIVTKRNVNKASAISESSRDLRIQLREINDELNKIITPKTIKDTLYHSISAINICKKTLSIYESRHHRIISENIYLFLKEKKDIRFERRQFISKEEWIKVINLIYSNSEGDFESPGEALYSITIRLMLIIEYLLDAAALLRPESGRNRPVAAWVSEDDWGIVTE